MLRLLICYKGVGPFSSSLDMLFTGPPLEMSQPHPAAGRNLCPEATCVISHCPAASGHLGHEDVIVRCREWSSPLSLEETDTTVQSEFSRFCGYIFKSLLFRGEQMFSVKLCDNTRKRSCLFKGLSFLFYKFLSVVNISSLYFTNRSYPGMLGTLAKLIPSTDSVYRCVWSLWWQEGWPESNSVASQKADEPVSWHVWCMSPLCHDSFTTVSVNNPLPHEKLTGNSLCQMRHLLRLI